MYIQDKILAYAYIKDTIGKETHLKNGPLVK